MDIWKDVTPEEPADNTKVLVYTDFDDMKVARRINGRWDTYTKVLKWTELPKKPKITKEK